MSCLSIQAQLSQIVHEHGSRVASDPPLIAHRVAPPWGLSAFLVFYLVVTITMSGILFSGKSTRFAIFIRRPMLALNFRGEPIRLTFARCCIWFGFASVLAGLGSYFTKHGPLSSEAHERWLHFFAPSFDPTFLDMIRVLGAVAIALVIFNELGLFSAEPNADRSIGELRFSAVELVMTALMVGVLTYAAFIALPDNFTVAYAHDINRHLYFPKSPDPLSTAQVRGPYYRVYFAYVYGLWLFIFYPVLFFLVRAVSRDYRDYTSRLRGIGKIEAEGDLLVYFKSACQWDRDSMEWLYGCGHRYIVASAALILGAVVEIGSQIHCTTVMSHDTYVGVRHPGNVALLVIIVAALAGVYLPVLQAFRKLYSTYTIALSKLNEKVLRPGIQARGTLRKKLDDLARDLNRERDEHAGRRGDARFLLSLLRQDSVSLLLTVAVGWLLLHGPASETVFQKTDQFLNGTRNGPIVKFFQGECVHGPPERVALKT